MLVARQDYDDDFIGRMLVIGRDDELCVPVILSVAEFFFITICSPCYATGPNES